MANNITKKLAKAIPYEYHVPIETTKERRKCIERIKGLVRSSMEYKDYIFYLKQFAQFDKCAFYQQLSSSNPASKAKIEAHHGPLTIDDVCAIVLQKYIDEGLEINEILIAEEVLELHYRNMVGLTPLSKTVHQIITDSDKVFVPVYMYYGNWMDFLDEYSEYIDEKHFDKIEDAIEKTRGLTEESFDALKVQFTYLDVDGQDAAERIATDEEVVTVA